MWLRRRGAMVRVAWLGPVLVLGACSPGTGGIGSNRGAADGAGGGGSGAAPNGTGADGTVANGNGGDTFVPIDTTSSGGSGSGTDAGHQCGGETLPAERDTITVDAGTIVTMRPVALYIMLDQSLSMDEPGAVAGSTKWTTVVDGIKSFVNDPRSAGIDAALSLFPPMFGSPGACDGTGYDTPYVPMAPLNGNAGPITAALGSPTGLGTPTEGGLRGAEKYCQQYQVAHPDEDCVVVFATDGQPSTCDTNQTDLTKVVSDAYAQGVKTFAIGMAGATAGEVDFNFLNALAKAGGTNCNPGSTGKEACDVGGGSDMSTALNTIRQTVTQHQTKTVVRTSQLACEFKTPDTSFDPQKVNISFQGSSGTTEKVLQVSSEGDCSKATSKAWYYDDPATPTKILLCPSTCAAINAGVSDGGLIAIDNAGSAPVLDISLGCKTEVAIIQ